MAHRIDDLIIEAGRSQRHYWAEVWRYRELFVFLAWRDLLVRYKQTAAGVLWAVARPLITMTVFTLVFGKLAGLPSEGVPYPLMVFAAMLPWHLFANAFADAGNSLVNNASMIGKIYFPRLVMPASTMIVSCVDFLISLLLLALLMLWYGHVPGPQLIVLPLFTLLALAAAMGAGLWVAALNVKYRDFRYIIPFTVQLGLYISPVGFSSSVVPERWRMLYCLNPMVGVIDGFRWALLGTTQVYWPGVLLSVILVALIFTGGLAFFRRAERSVADVI